MHAIKVMIHLVRGEAGGGGGGGVLYPSRFTSNHLNSDFANPRPPRNYIQLSTPFPVHSLSALLYIPLPY